MKRLDALDIMDDVFVGRGFNAVPYFMWQAISQLRRYLGDAVVSDERLEAWIKHWCRAMRDQGVAIVTPKDDPRRSSR